MTIFMYTVWFKDNKANPKDQDYEWVACIRIEAENKDFAKQWGDKLSKKYDDNHSNESYLSSTIEPLEKYNDKEISSTPLIKYGDDATDEEIGW